MCEFVTNYNYSKKKENSMASFCVNCGTELPPGALFCDNCGHAVKGAPAPAEPSPEEVRKAEEEAVERAASKASEQIGEAAFGLPGVKQAAEKLTPFKTIGAGAKNLISSIVGIFKEPKKLIPAAVLAGVWLILLLLKSFGIEPFPAKALSFLTFAKGGLHGGVLGAIGGLIGKGALAGAVTSLIGLITKKDKTEKRSFGESVKGAFGFSLENVWPYVLGAGVAVFLFLFISGCATRGAFMGGAAASYLSARAANKNGFLKKLLSSFTSKGSENAGEGAKGFISGLASGFGLSSLIGLSDIDLILIILGAVLVVGGAVMLILKAAGVLKFGKEAAVQ